MRAKYLMDKPVLTIGILFFIIFILGLKQQGYFKSFKNRFSSTSCHGVINYLDKRLPKEAKAECKDNHLSVNWDILISDNIKVEKPEKILAANYRELANNLSFIAKNSPEELLARTLTITLSQKSQDYHLVAFTEGRFLVKLKNLNSTELIAEHLKNTVKVKELPKD